MTPAQLELARHALGLPNGRKRSYRNSFVTGEESPDHAPWMDMVSAGLANRRAKAKHYGGMDIFWLTTSGAKAALVNGERLDPEDFADTADQSLTDTVRKP